MTVEYLVLGIVLVLMGAGQIWLRHGPGAKEMEREAGRGAGRTTSPVYPAAAPPRARRAWNAWTAVVGGIGIALGILLIVLGSITPR